MKYIINYIIVLSVIFGGVCMLCGCNQKSNDIRIVENTSLIKENDTIYSYSLLNKQLQNRPSAKILQKKIGTLLFKHNQYGIHTVINTDKGYVLILFDENQKSYCHMLLSFSHGANEDQLNNIAVGTLLSEIQKIDPNGHYPFLFASWSEYPKLSYHLVSEKCYRLEYNEDMMVSHIDVFEL